ncbi:UDP-2,3-diacylglucosamine hydrolase [Ekhidna lutea]|uniref:UDP-2,3-diacylglucosamine hydrolase n=1 Tax=Ekhidna lutea TaxID=447679 RepID=A0A239JCY4_EKHLU|nr:UDP-2,3-diacylglucosamine diphosphatase [Ekhidna lutea]SNT02534.1 UDP-2,3-diacylglucosamine hydrolase [Ekhidna lutea]
MKVNPEQISSFQELPSDKRIYFASDFHLGAPNEKESLDRELKIIRWLQHVSKDAAAIFLVGDIFDFWFEYKSTIPKGFIRFQGKLAELRDNGIPIIFFAGNHDMWMRNYFPNQLNIPVYKNPATLTVNNTKIFVGHGDGLGPGDKTYKFLKKLFSNRLLQGLFQWIHPNIGVWVAKSWADSSRDFSDQRSDTIDLSKERLFQFCEDIENNSHHDLYIFGHRHHPLELKVSENSTYFNLGEWINHCTYLEFDGKKAALKVFED